MGSDHSLLRPLASFEHTIEAINVEQSARDFVVRLDACIIRKKIESRQACACTETTWVICPMQASRIELHRAGTSVVEGELVALRYEGQRCLEGRLFWLKLMSSASRLRPVNSGLTAKPSA